jgi:hypothetical protein
MNRIRREHVLSIPISMLLSCSSLVPRWGFSPSFAETDHDDNSQECCYGINPTRLHRFNGLPEIPVTRPPPHVALVATSGMNRLASCGASWRRSDRSRDGASAPLSGTGRDRLKAAAMRHEDVIRCGLCGVKLAIIEQNEA